MSRQTLETYYAIAHSLIQDSFIEATTILAERFQLFETQPDLREELNRASHAGGMLVVAEVLGQFSKDERPEGP